mgnify:CR=1 FL=1|tara:strand:- start:19966 stop:20565 length:600 start_codon:yes stop_codon:yes gene_type:complete
MKAPAGRGRLSSIDQLPDWADEARVWAFEQLREKKLTQVEILDGFNERLRAAAWQEGISDPPQISSSAFNRTALRIARLGRRLAETREIAAVLAPRLDEVGDDQLTLLISNTIKTLVNEMLENAGELAADGATAEMLMFTSRALKHAEEAKRISTDTRSKIDRELRDKTEKAIETVAKERGMTADTVEAIKSKVLGISK